MNNYDLTVVLDGKTTPAKKKAFIQKMENLVEVLEGKTSKVDDLGSKNLAYLIGKSTAGLYLNFVLKFSGESAKKFNDKLRVEEGILRYLLIRKDK